MAKNPDARAALIAATEHLCVQSKPATVNIRQIAADLPVPNGG